MPVHIALNHNVHSTYLFPILLFFPSLFLRENNKNKQKD